MKFIILLIPLLTLSLVACNGSDATTENDVDIVDALSADSDSASTQLNAKPSLSKAKSEHIKLHLATCSKKDRGNICIEICHRPPGNPENSKTLRLPLQATLAHLKHGHSSNPDTIGACDDNSEDDDEDDGDDHDCDHDDGIITIPEWCLVKYDQDKNCDGFDDITGVSLY